jgi:pyrroloquinoline quinone biosynthesis protein E
VSGPALRRGVRLGFDPVRGRAVLLYPEGVLVLDDVAADVVERCDGRRTVAGIAADLAGAYDEVPLDEVAELVGDLVARRVLVTDGTGHPARCSQGPAAIALPDAAGPAMQPRAPVPVGLLAELTYRCPLRCTYCSNPVNLRDYRPELSTADWLRVLGEARDLGVLQTHFSGGEPLLRRDLTELVAQARRLGMYTNLITSGIPLNAARLGELVDAGLDHLQLSIQDADRAAADAVAGIAAHDRKRAVAALVRASGLAFTVNVVLHRANLDRLLSIAELAVALGAERLELAHTQFYGWGLRNRAALIPTEAQVAEAGRQAAQVRARFGDTVEIVYVLADYHTGRPKPCMDGWGRRQLVVAPNGDVLPCLAAGQLPDLEPPNVHSGSLADAWYGSAAFNRYRGTAWMPEPCRSCALRELDFGGCRCQAYQLTGDPAATDPACELSPQHHLMAAARRSP